MEFHLNNNTLKGSAEVIVNGKTVACFNDILSTIIPVLQNNYLSDSNVFRVKCGRDNTPNVSGQSGLNSIYTENRHLTYGQGYSSGVATVDLGEVDLTVTQTYVLKIPVGNLIGPLGEVGVDFTATDTPDVQTRFALPAIINVGATDEITVNYTFTTSVRVIPGRIDFEYEVDGVIVPATADIAYHNTNLYKVRHFLNHVGRLGGFRFAETAPSNLNNYASNPTSNPTKVWTTDGATSVLEFNFDATQGNFDDGIGFFQMGDNSKPYMSFTFNPPIPKMDSQKLRLFFVKDFANVPTI